jgi:hypothetical protein
VAVFKKVLFIPGTPFLPDVIPVAIDLHSAGFVTASIRFAGFDH